MSERLTDQQLQILSEQWQPAAIELLALRARVAKLEAALQPLKGRCDPVGAQYVLKPEWEAIAAALKDAPYDRA